ncbi:MAG: formate dehydrogenase accessory sulfurtransferase FdhD [Aeromicrobium sp.]
MSGRRTTRARVTRIDVDGVASSNEDQLAVEEPLEVRVNGKSFSVTMRTPGDDFDLVAGFLVSEGVVWAQEQIASLRYCSGVDEAGLQTFNVIDAQLSADTAPPDVSLERHIYTSSSCGICGTASIDAVHKAAHFGQVEPVSIDHSVVAGLPDALREQQRVFDRTGGTHAAGLFTASGELLCLREDVGRHNAVDKVVGWALREGRLPLRSTVLQVSGRASFELVQKAHMAGIPALSSVSAPSSLAVEHALSAGMTLVGFNRDGRFTVFAA